MSHSINLFVSFSGKDQHDMRKLFASLQLQELGVWDYSRDGQELLLGQPLDKSLMRRIDDCDYFIAVVSANSTHEQIGHNTRMEVQYAIERGLMQQGRLLPFLLLNNQPGEWPGDYGQMKGLVRAEADLGSFESLEEAVRGVCGWLSVAYVPPFLSDPRVFFARRFMQEAQEADAITLSNDKYLELMRILSRCAGKVLREEWGEALEEIMLFKLFSDSKASRPEDRFYYPQIIKGVCELQLRDYGEAEKTFLAATRHPRRDESALAGLGHTYYGQRRYPEALGVFQEAFRLNPAERDIEFNILGTLLEAGEQAGDGAVLQHYDTLEMSPQDRFKVNKIKGILLYRQHKYREAAAVFGAMRVEDMDDACADYYSSALEECGRKREAIAVLRAVAARLEDTNLYHLLARAYLRMGEIDSCLRVYEEKLSQPAHRTRQFLIEHARVLKAFGTAADGKRVRELCEAVLSSNCFPNTEMKGEEFFYTGFANYLLGRLERARDHFEWSSGFCDKFYDDPAYWL